MISVEKNVLVRNWSLVKYSIQKSLLQKLNTFRQSFFPGAADRLLIQT
jgi:hypothetical protein